MKDNVQKERGKGGTSDKEGRGGNEIKGREMVRSKGEER